jgi:hypothetical protein
MRKLHLGLSLACASAVLLQAALACCSLAPARFSNTRGLAAEVQVDKKLFHLLGYQNTAQNLAVKAGQPTGNALLLPIPAKPGTMTSKSILDTSSAPNFLVNMESAVRPPVSRSNSYSKSVDRPPVQVFEHDIYTIVLAGDARAIPAALAQVPPDRRPRMAPAIFDSYAKWYPGWTFALCCFNVQQETAARPMLWQYEPLHADRLFFPALDAHDGSPPNLKESVEVDHCLLAGSDKMAPNRGNRVYYSDKKRSAELRRLLPAFVVGEELHKPMRNGDFELQISDVRAGHFRPRRVQPPGA